jgi:hypothetical protein
MGTGMTAMLVAPEDVGGRPDGITAMISRGEIEEALASDAPLDLILDLERPKEGRVETTDVKVAWQREDLERLLDLDTDAVMLSFDPAVLERAMDEPDFEGHGIREMVLLTVAAASASAALAASTASGHLVDAGAGGGGAVAAVVAPGHDEATTAQAVAATAAVHDEATLAARGIGQTVPGNDEATLAQRGIDVSVAPSVGTGDATTARDLAAPAGIHDEATLAERGIGQTIPANDEATLAQRGIEAPAVHDEASLSARGIEGPVAVDSGTSFELPSVDPGTAAAIGGLAGAGLVIVAAGFAARRQRPGAA